MTNEDIALHAGATVARWQREALEIIQKRVSEQQRGDCFTEAGRRGEHVVELPPR